MVNVRQPAVAGSFYPANPTQLHGMVQGYLAMSATDPLGPPKAIIAPHAGFVYSGPVAASAYAQLSSIADQIHRVVLLGPSHRVPFRGLATTSADFYVTPIGPVAVDRAAISVLDDLPFVQVLDEAHRFEHSLEVHLPFLQEILKTFVLVPLVVGDATPEEVAQVLERLWGGAETLIVISSDLSHYHDYAIAQHKDNITSKAIEQLRYQDIQYDDACGRIPISGLLYLAQRMGLHCKALDVRNSGDTSGTRDKVVGYGSYVFH